MRGTILVVLALIVALIVPSFAEQKPNSYTISINLKPEQHYLQSVAEISYTPSADTSSIRFLLNKALKVTKVDCASCKGFRFATNEASPYRYIADGAPLYIDLKQTTKAGTPLLVKIEYEGVLPPHEWGVNMLSPDWTELALYIGWYPFMPEMKNFRYDLAVVADPAYTISGEGDVRQLAPTRWLLHETKDTTDIVLIAARGLKTKSVAGQGSLRVQYPDGISDKDADLVLTQMQKTLASCTSWFGPAVGGRLTLVLNTRPNGGSYVRPGFVSLAYAPSSSGALETPLVRTIGHEISHLWWTGADVTTWEDWLNESFAEYTALLMVKESLGADAFEKVLAKSRERTAGKPAVWGIDRSDEVAYFVLYEKGALLLNNLANQMGEKKFLALAAESAHMKPRTTAEFLARLQKATSPEVRNDFEAALKQ